MFVKLIEYRFEADRTLVRRKGEQWWSVVYGNPFSFIDQFDEWFRFAAMRNLFLATHGPSDMPPVIPKP